nr:MULTISPECIES: oligosaccharide flippase family protein [unclassified Mesobacillus]
MRFFKNKLIRNSLIYTLGSMITPLVGLIMLPIFTKFLDPSEYGVMVTIQTLVGLLQLFLVLSLHGAITRFYYDFVNDDEKSREYLGSIFTFVVILASILAITLIIFRDTIGGVLFKTISIDPYFYYLVGLAWILGVSSLQMALIRVQEKAGLFILINIIRELLIMISTTYLIMGKGWGADSALISQFTINIIVVLFTFGIQLKFFKLSLNVNHIKRSLIFSIPLIPHVASSWIINSSDKVILEKFVPIAEVGIYSLAVQVSMVLVLFYSSINNAIVPQYTRLRTEGKEEIASRMLKKFSYIVIFFGIISIPIAIYAIKLFASKEYYSAISIIPFLLVGKVLTGLYYIPVAKLFYEKKTKAIAMSSTVSAVINVLINLVLIPLIGVSGAIASTMVSELLRYVFIFKASKKSYSI